MNSKITSLQNSVNYSRYVSKNIKNIFERSAKAYLEAIDNVKKLTKEKNKIESYKQKSKIDANKANLTKIKRQITYYRKKANALESEVDEMIIMIRKLLKAGPLHIRFNAASKSLESLKRYFPAFEEEVNQAPVIPIGPIAPVIPAAPIIGVVQEYVTDEGNKYSVRVINRYGSSFRDRIDILNASSGEAMLDVFNSYKDNLANEDKDVYFITLYLRNLLTGQLLYRSLKYAYFVDHIANGELTGEELLDDLLEAKVGSDYHDEQEYQLLTNVFDIFGARHLVLGVSAGKSSNIMYLNSAIDQLQLSKNEFGLCGLSCLTDIAEDMGLVNEDGYQNLINKTEYIEKKLFIYDNLIDYCLEKKISFAVIQNYFQYREVIKTSEYKNLEIKKVRKGKDIRVKKIDINKVSFNVKSYSISKHITDDNKKAKITQERILSKEGIFSEFTNVDYLLIHCPEIGHIEWCKTCDLAFNKEYEFYYHPNGDIYGSKNDGPLELLESQYKKIEKLKEYNFEGKRKINDRYLILDYETIVEWKEENVNKPYSLAYIDLAIEDFELLESYEQIMSGKNNDINYIMNYMLQCDHIVEKLLSEYGENEERETYELLKVAIKKRFTIDNKIDIEKLKKHYDLEKLPVDVQVIKGHDCTRKLIDYINANDEDIKYYFVTFNGSNFDNYLLYDGLIRYDESKDYVGEVLLSKGQMLNFTYRGRHTCFDIRKHLMGSLKMNCKGFDIKALSKKDDFSHADMQKLYDNGELFKFLDDNDKKLVEYNSFDVLSLALLFYRYRTNINNIQMNGGFEFGSIEHFPTLGMMVNKSHVEQLESQKIKLPKFYISKKDLAKLKNKEDITNEEVELYNTALLKAYQNIRDWRVAGRVQLFNSVQKIYGVINSLDVCSLYPYVMAIAPNYYPGGDIIQTTEYVSDKLGYYWCSIDQSNLNVNIVARKDKEGNNWEETIQDHVFISTPIIEYLKKNNCRVVIKEGIYFTEKIKGCELFKFILDIMKLKNEQDKLKEVKDPKYNSSLRETYKLIINIQSGKLNQGLVLDSREIIDFDKFFKMKKNDERVNAVHLVGEKLHVNYRKSEEECIKKAKSICVGGFIYDYAKLYMHEHMYGKCPKEELIYTDTDSNKLRENAFNIWVESYGSKVNVPHWPETEKYDDRLKDHKLYQPNSKVFGSFEDEYKDKEMDVSYWLQKKVYLCAKSDMYTNDKINKALIDEKYSSFHYKGVSKRDIVLTDNEVEELEIQKRAEIYNYDSKYKKISDNYIEFFENMYNDKKCKLLTFSMSKSYNNTKIDKINMEDKTLDIERLNQKCYHIITNYRIKNLKL